MTRFLKSRPKPRRSLQKGFTLVELLVVIGILIILTVMTLMIVNVTQDEDRVRSGAAQVQSYLEGARDRAIHAGEPRGVRFLYEYVPHPSDPSKQLGIATSLIYVGAPELYGRGQRVVVFRARNSNFDQLDPQNRLGWDNLVDRGLLSDGSPIFFGNNPGDIQAFYTINIRNKTGMIPPGQSKYFYLLTKRYSLPGSAVADDPYYLIPLNPTVLPNQEPRQLPRGVVVDLDNSKIPKTWGTSGSYGTLDILFSPHGTVTGLVASEGVVHLVVADQVDVDRAIPPGYQLYNDPSDTPDLGTVEREGNERIVSVRTQTGGISVHNVDITDEIDTTDPMNPTAGTDNKPDDPFRLAARGEPAK